VSNAAKLISYNNYDWQQAAVDAMILQTSNAKLRERCLQDNVSYDDMMKLGISKEQSVKGAALLEQASGNSSTDKATEEVRRLKLENKKLKSRLPTKECSRCGSDKCKKGNKCPAIGQICSGCKKPNHFRRVCRSTAQKNQKSSFGQISSAEESDSDEPFNRIVVGKLGKSSISATVDVEGVLSPGKPTAINLATDTGISKTLLNSNDWYKIREQCKFVKTSKGFRPYGTAFRLPIKGKSKVTLTAKRGAKITTWVYVVNDPNEQSLLGEEDATRLGIVTLDVLGAPAEVVKHISHMQATTRVLDDVAGGGQTQDEIDTNMKHIIEQFLSVFSNSTGKFIGSPIKLHVKPDAIPVIQPQRRIPLHYVSRLEKELQSMLQDDVIEGPISTEEPGTFISNLVITDKKNTDRIRVTLDCTSVNREIYRTHEPIPTTEELRHKLKGSDRFSTLDMTNCYYQFEIEEKARKLFAFRTPWGIFRYKRMVMGTSPASSEIQKKIRQAISECKNAIHIKDDILVYGKGNEHDHHLQEVLKTLGKKGLTLRPDKCKLGKPQVKWFGNVYSKDGMSPDPDKCKIIKEWPEPKSIADVKSFLQTVQFNSKFLEIVS